MRMVQKAPTASHMDRTGNAITCAKSRLTLFPLLALRGIDMRSVYSSDIKQEFEFAEKAAAHFAAHPEHSTYTDGEIVPACFFAVRWGLGDDCVVVLKLDENHTPTNYQNLVHTFQSEAT
jgi:hypothetical protein